MPSSRDRESFGSGAVLLLTLIPLFLLSLHLPAFAAEEKKETQKEESSSEEPKMVHLNFVGAEIKDVAKTISEVTGFNFVISDRVRGKITIISAEPMTPKEAYNAFVSALALKRFTAIKEGKIVKIIDLSKVKSSPIPTEISP